MSGPRLRMVIVGGALAAVLGAGCESDGTGDRGRVVPRPAPASGPVTLGDQDPGLDRAYENCVNALGFDPGGVQVLVGDGGVPWSVKTGRDVPAAFHRPCFRVIGGGDPQLSSHGNP